MTGTSPEALKQGGTAMPYQSHKRARKREKLSTHKLWPQRRTVNPQKQCAADEKAQRSVIVLAARKDEHPPPQCRRSSVGRAPRQEVCRWFESHRLHHRRDLLPRSRTERKPAEVVFPVRCTKAAGRRNLCIGWHRLCKDERMRPTYRRRAEKFCGIPALLHSARVPRRSMDVVWWRQSYD